MDIITYKTEAKNMKIKEALNHNVFRITSDCIDTPLRYPIYTIDDIVNWEIYDILHAIHLHVCNHFLAMLWAGRKQKYDSPFSDLDSAHHSSGKSWRLRI